MSMKNICLPLATRAEQLAAIMEKELQAKKDWAKEKREEARAKKKELVWHLTVILYKKI